MQIVRIRGDWTRDGYIDDRDREPFLRIAIVGGQAYNVDMDGQPETREPPIGIDADGALCPAGASVGFLPYPGQIERIGGEALFRRI